MRDRSSWAAALPFAGDFRTLDAVLSPAANDDLEQDYVRRRLVRYSR